MNQIEIYQTKDKQTEIEVKFEEETVWLTQKQMALLFKNTVPNINMHIRNIYKEKELDKNPTIKESLIVQKEGKRLIKKKEASALFGNERDRGFESTLNSVVQTFDGEYLYKSIEEQAAHLLYFVIKNHPFTDGNKRIGAFLFVWFLEKNKHRFKKS